MLAIALVSCGRVGFDPMADAMLGPWAPPTPLGVANTADDEEDVGGSSTGLELYFGRRTGLNTKQLWVTTRAAATDAWNAPVLASVNDGTWASSPRLSLDDLALYFESVRTGGAGGYDVWTATRTAVDAPWSPPTNFAEINTALDERWFSPCLGGRYLIVRGSDAAGTSDIYEGVIGGAPAQPVAELNDPAGQSSVYITPDCRTVFFWSSRSGNDELYTATRPASDGAWSIPQRMTDFDTQASEQDPWMSADGRMFVFASDRDGTMDLFISTR